MAGVEHTCDLADAAATQDLGRRLATDLLRHPAAGPALLLLQGDLGAGKTCLVQGLAAGLGINEPITSPTFALAQHYEGRLADGTATALVHLCSWLAGEPQPLASQQVRWVAPAELADYPFPAANSRIIAALLEHLAAAGAA